MPTSYLPWDVYLRLSDLRLEDMNAAGQSTGLAYHETLLRDFAERLGVPIGEVITENDIVDGKPKPASAWKRKTVTLADGRRVQRVIRPGFVRILDRLRTRESGGFLAIDLDRVVRDPRDLEDLIDVVKETGSNVRSLTGSLTFTDGGTGSEQTNARIMVAVATKSSLDTSRRVASARQRQAKNGEWHGGKRPYGFEGDGITHREAEVAEIRNAGLKVLAGVSLRAITQDLRDRGVPTVKGGPWSPSTLKDILMRPRNVSIMVYRGKEIPTKAPWEPIFEIDQFRAICDKLTVRKAASGRAARWLGSGIYICTCGGKMGAHEQKSRPARYRCKDTGLMSGKHTSRLAGKIDTYIADLVIEFAAQPVALKRLLPTDMPKIDVADLRVQAESLRVRLEEKVRMNFLDPNRLTDEQLYIFTEATNKRLREIDQLLAKALPLSPVIDLVNSAGTESEMSDRRAKVRENWLSMSLGVQREIVRELMEVRLFPAPSGRHFDPRLVEIKWKA